MYRLKEIAIGVRVEAQSPRHQQIYLHSEEEV